MTRLAHLVRSSYLSMFVAALVVTGCTPAPAPAPAGEHAASTGTEILWDTYGVPHIFAPDHASLFQAYGYAQMEAHSELLIRLYAQARGRGAEFYGERYLSADRWVRTNGLPDTARQWAAAQSPEFAPLIAAFVKGLNAWADEHQSDISAEAKGVLPLTIEDVYAHGLRVIHYDWIVSPSRLEGRLARWEQDVHGSNEWAIAPARSATGKALLMSNSHLQWGDIHTYFEVQLTAPGVTSYGAVWVGFPVLRQCFTEYVGWTQTTNNPSESDLYRLVLKGDGYVLDGQVKQFDTHTETIKVRHADGTLRDEPLTVRRTAHGPVVAERGGAPIAMRVAALDRPKMFEQFWRMGLAKNFSEWDAAMRMHQLPLFNTAYADRDGHIAYIYNSTLWKHPTGDYRFWQGVVPGDRSDLIATEIVPYDEIPKVIDPPQGWIQNSNDMPWTSTYPATLDATKFAAGFAAPQGITQRAQRGTRILSTAPEKISFEDVKSWKLSTRVETADQFVDDIVSAAKARGTERAKRAADVLAKWDRQSEVDSDGMLLFFKFMTAAGPSFGNIGGFQVPTDDRRPLETPRGFKDPAKAMAVLDTVAGDVEKEYGSLAVKWGDVLRFRRGNTDLPGNGAPSQLGAIRTIGVSPFKDGKVDAVHGDTFYAVIEYSVPQRAEVLLNYGNWSKKGSKHIDDQLPLASRKEMRPMWRTKAEIEPHLERRMALPWTTQAVAPAAACRDEQGLTYVCNLSVPEDILIAGSSGLLLVSGHRAPGHLYLIDPAKPTPTDLIHSATFRMQHDTGAYPACPGPLNLEAFDTHGLSLAETSPRVFSLYTTSHGAREAIEIYDLDLRGTAPILTWKGCVLLQQDSYHNSVARLADGGFVTTRMRDQNFRGGGGAPAGITGHLIEWHPGGQPRALPGTEMSLPNGIDVSKDERYIYVAAIGSQELVRFDRQATPMTKRTVSLPIRPDNVHWSPSGTLLTAGPNYVSPTVCSGAGCATGWSVLDVDPETFAFTRLGGADQTAAMQRVSSAMRVGDDIWVGSNDDRIARFSLRRP